METTRRYIAKGTCQKCGAREVIAHVGRKHLCKRCSPEMWNDVCAEQKANYMSTGRVFKMHKSAKKF